MKLNKKNQLALEIMITLGSDYDKYYSVTELARLRNTTAKYLEQIMSALKKAGLVAVKGGKYGGYKANITSDSSVYDVICAIEQDLEVVACKSKGCDKINTCYTFPVWQQLEDTLIQQTKKMKLQKMITSFIEVKEYES